MPLPSGILDPVPWIACSQFAIILFWLWSFQTLPLASAILAFNTSWFGAAFIFFAVLGDSAMPWLLPRKIPKQWYNKVKAATMFLGGMNSALAVLSFLVLRAFDRQLFQRSEERSILFCCFALGHFSQFVCNIPSFLVSKGLVKGQGLTPILKRFDLTWQELLWETPDQTMFFIFIVDGLAFVLNLYAMHVSFKFS